MHWLSDYQRSRIQKLSLQKPEEESCGFVLADGTVIEVDNQATDRANEFSIDPVCYASWDATIGINGIWHSHLTLAGFSPLDQQVMAADILPWAVYCMADDSWHECDPQTVAPLEGRPFCFGHYDCYSLIRDYLKGLCVTLPEWERGRWGEWNTPNFQPFDLEWENHGKPVTDKRYQKGDILLFNLGDHPGHTDHVGVFIDPQHFLHHPAQRQSRIQTYGSYWANRLNWVIRPFALCSS